MSLPAFDYTDNVRRVCAHMVARLPELQHIELSRVAFSFSLARKRVRHGLLATLTPMRFQDGARTTQRHGRAYTAQRLFDKRGNEMLYILTVYLPRFQNQSLAEALATLLHELWHISPQSNGDLRRFRGRYYMHGSSEQAFDAQVQLLLQRLLDQWPNRQPPDDVYRFLRSSFGQLQRQYGRVFGTKIQTPKLFPLTDFGPLWPGIPAQPAQQ